MPEWVVLAGFSQKVYSVHRGLQVEWFNGFKPDETSPYVLAPNIYKFDGCPDSRTKLDSQLGIPLPVGPVYGTPELCAAYLGDGSLVPDQMSSVTDATWWMDDRTLAGRDGACDIIGKTNRGNVELICEGHSGIEELATRKYREEGRTRYVGDIALTRCRP